MTEVDQSASPGSAPVIWGDVPQRNKNFTGRDGILDRLRRDAFSKVTAVLPREDPLPQALQGLGGVGKTAIAIEYAHRFRADYDVVWWIPSEQLPLVRASLAALAGRLGLQEAMATGIEGATAAALDALRRGHPYSRWLLIFDNADQPEDFREYIPGGAGDVLITSRNHRWQATIDTVQVDVFSRPESKEFLRKRAPVQVTDPDANRLADKLGDLPLALDQAGAMLAESGMPVEEYIALLDDKITQIMAEGRSAEYPRPVTAAWTLSVEKVRQQLPQAQELLRCCAFFGPDPIPRDVFRRGTQATGTRVSDLMADPILLARAIRELGRYALVTIGGRAISVHRLVQALLRDELDKEEQAQYRNDVHAILAAAAPKDPSDDRQWARYRELLPHVTSEATGITRSPDPQVREFVLNTIRYLYLSGDVSSCIALTTDCIAQWTADTGPDDPAVIAAKRHYGDLLRQLGQYSNAYGLVEETMGVARKELGESDRLTLALRNAFGGDLRANGNFSDALRLDEETLRLHEEVLGADDPQTLRIVVNLGNDYGLNGKYHEAEDLCRRAHIRSSQAAVGVSATEVLISWYTLAWAVRMQGRFTEARDVGEEAWDYGRERLGSDHFTTLRTAIGLSIAQRRIAPARMEAMQIARDSYGTCQKRFGDNHPDTMAAAINLENALRVNSLLDEAFALAEETVQRYPAVYGPDHPYNYGCAGNLALMQRVVGDVAEARRLNEFALEGLDRRLTRSHLYTLTVAVNLASDLSLLNEPAAARALNEDTLARLVKLLGKDHPLTLGCAANLVVDLRNDSAASEADSLYADTMNRYEATLGLSHSDAVVAAEGGRLDFDFDPPPI
jgi:tetratricopeptide (TPR) repeat protein